MSGLHLLAAPVVLPATDLLAEYGPSSGRFGAMLAALVGLISVLMAGLALARSTGRLGTGSGRGAAVLAVAVGLTGCVLAVVHLGNSTGGFGTGNGRAGAIVALVIGLIGVNLGGLVLARAKARKQRT